MKKLILILTFLLYALPNIAESRPKVGVVLSGGGAKGTAHVGVLKVLEKAGIPIDYIVGTSMGAIVGSLYSIGYSPEELDSIMMKQDWNRILAILVEGLLSRIWCCVLIPLRRWRWR